MLGFVLVPFAALALAMGGHPAGILDSDEAVRERTEGWRPVAEAAAREAGVPVDLLLALVSAESSGRDRATSGAGAVGLAQLMPPTARAMAARIPGMDPEDLDLFDPAVNLRLGAAVLAEELRAFGGDAALALAAYHRGPAAPAAWRRADPGADGLRVVRDRAAPVTRAYVERVLDRRAWFAAKPAVPPVAPE
jgi:soluble lytic murein transglycosylase